MDTIVSTIEENEDIGNTVLFRYTNSTQEDHQHLCAVVGAMSQELKDQKLPLTPITYFGATISSLDRLSTDPNPADSVITALLTFLSMVLPQISVPVLRKRRAFVMDPVLRVIRFEDMSVGAVNAGLKCVSHVLVVSEKVNWLDISKEYNVLLVFVTDSRSKVRKQSHSCLRDILQSFQRSAVLAPASEGITSIFERFLLLAGGSSSTDSGPRKGAQEVLHILDALKNCLSLMSMNAVTSILKYFKSLLELRQPLVTRRIANSLQLLCLSPTSEVASDILLDLLCKLAKSASEDEKSVDSLTFTARLLDVGIRKVYSLNRESSVKKLPFIFYALGEILACEHEEAAFAAMEALRGLISSCIDGGLIKEEVEQMSDDEAPTTIVKICANIEKLLDDRFSAVWDLSLKVVSVMFDKLGEFSFKLLRGTVMSLANMQDLTDEALQYRKQLHECFGSALGAMGPKRFLVLLPLNLEAKDPSKANVWLFPILKQYTVGASLSFFGKSILGKVGELRQKSQMLEQEGQIYSSRSSDVVQRAKATYTPQVAAENLNALKLAARKFLSVLSGVFMKSTTDSGGCVQAEKDAKRKAKAKELKKLRKAKEKAQAQAVLAQNAPSVSHNQRAIPGIKTEPRTSKGVQLSKEEELKMAQVAEREKRAAAAEKRIAAAAALSAQGTRTSAVPSSSELPKGAVNDLNCSCCNVSLSDGLCGAALGFILSEAIVTNACYCILKIRNC